MNKKYIKKLKIYCKWLNMFQTSKLYNANYLKVILCPRTDKEYNDFRLLVIQNFGYETLIIKGTELFYIRIDESLIQSYH